MNYIKLAISGVTQMYAYKNAITVANSSIHRKTATHPTKSAMIGLIGAALGYKRGNSKLDDLRKNLDIRYKTIRKGQVIEWVHTIRPPKLKKYPNSDQLTTVKTDVDPKTGEAKYNRNSGNLIVYDEYLTDYVFDVYVGAESDDLLKEIYDSILCPTYNLYLGKKVCMPFYPIVRGFETISEEELGGIDHVYDCA